MMVGGYRSYGSMFVLCVAHQLHHYVKILQKYLMLLCVHFFLQVPIIILEQGIFKRRLRLPQITPKEPVLIITKYL